MSGKWYRPRRNNSSSVPETVSRDPETKARSRETELRVHKMHGTLEHRIATRPAWWQLPYKERQGDLSDSISLQDRCGVAQEASWCGGQGDIGLEVVASRRWPDAVVTWTHTEIVLSNSGPGWCQVLRRDARSQTSFLKHQSRRSIPRAFSQPPDIKTDV